MFKFLNEPVPIHDVTKGKNVDFGNLKCQTFKKALEANLVQKKNRQTFFLSMHNRKEIFDVKCETFNIEIVKEYVERMDVIRQHVKTIQNNDSLN